MARRHGQHSLYEEAQWQSSLSSIYANSASGAGTTAVESLSLLEGGRATSGRPAPSLLPEVQVGEPFSPGGLLDPTSLSGSNSIGGLPARPTHRHGRRFRAQSERVACVRRRAVQISGLLVAVALITLVALIAARAGAMRADQHTLFERMRLFCRSDPAHFTHAVCNAPRTELWSGITAQLATVYRKPVDDLRDLSLANLVALIDAELFDSARLYLVVNGIVDANELATADQVQKRAVLSFAARTKTPSRELYALAPAVLEARLLRALRRDAAVDEEFAPRLAHLPPLETA